MGLSDLTAPAVNQAIEEFDQLKRKAFLKKYGLGKARGDPPQSVKRSRME